MAEKLQEYSLTWEVTDEMTAKRIGSAGSQILSTPNMVALMEAAALELAKSYLEEGQTTVGAEIHCRHLAPTPVVMKLTATAKLRIIERRKMCFDIEVNDEKNRFYFTYVGRFIHHAGNAGRCKAGACAKHSAFRTASVQESSL